MKDETKVVEIYSIPFICETYVPVSMNDIEKAYLRYGTINTYDTDFKAFLTNILKMKECKEDFHNIRAKFVFYDKRAIYIDKTGCVIDSNNITYQLDSNNLMKIKKLIFKHTELKETDKANPIRFAL